MRIAVITPYFAESEDRLGRCHASVRAQTHPCTQIFVADGRPSGFVAGLEAQHIVLGRGAADFGDTPRAIGAVSAAGQGFDAVAFLDADNWYRPTHIETLVRLHEETGAAVCTSARAIHAPDGRFLGPCPLCDGERHADTNCLFIARAGFGTILEWALMPHDLHAIGDRLVWERIKARNVRRAHSWKATLCYRASTRNDYRILGLEPPDGLGAGREDAALAFKTLVARGGPDLSDRITKAQAAAMRARVEIVPE